MNTTNNYDNVFYSGHKDGMLRSAEAVINILLQYCQFQSVIDVGCGRGAWLAVAEKNGASRLVGLDGNWVTPQDLLSKNIDFIPSNLETSLPKIDEKFDICISLEVAEHLSEDKADDFIQFLCSLSDTIVFSAAIKYQGGTNHINEQWQSYWVALFERYGYHHHDLFRGEIWNNKSVEWWYKQNIFLFTKPISGIAPATNPKNQPIDIVHPDNYEKKVNEFSALIKKYKYAIDNPTLGFCTQCLLNYIKNKIRPKRG